MKITGTIARDIIFEEHDDWKEVEKDIEGTRRWVTEYVAIHEHLPTGRFYQFHYDLPSTETSGEPSDTLWGDDDEVTPTEVTKKVIQVAKWVKV